MTMNLLCIFLTTNAALAFASTPGPFQTALTSNYYVDKTLIVQEFVAELPVPQLITAPNGFGKSTNLDTIKTFFQIHVDKYGFEVQNKTTTPNFKLFTEPPLHISQNAAFATHFGQFPVIYLSLSTVNCTDYTQIVQHLKGAFSKTYGEHLYVLENLLRSRLNETSGGKPMNFAQTPLDGLLKLMKEKNIPHTKDTEHFLHFYRGTIAEPEMYHALDLLCRLLRGHFGKRVIVLIDDFDHPWRQAIALRSPGDVDVDNLKKILNKMVIVALKQNADNVRNAVLTGVSQLLLATESTHLIDAMEYPFLEDYRFAKYIGFTLHEVLVLLMNLEAKNLLHDLTKDQHLKIIMKNFNGYHINDNCTLIETWIVSPHAIIDYLKLNKVQHSWGETSQLNLTRNPFLEPFLSDDLTILLKDGKIDFQMQWKTGEKIVRNTIRNDYQLVFNANSTEAVRNYFFTHFFELGFLTTTVDKHFKLPNLNILLYLEDNIDEAFPTAVEHYLHEPPRILEYLEIFPNVSIGIPILLDGWKTKFIAFKC